MSTQILRHEFTVGGTFPSMAALKNEAARYFAERNLAFRLPINDKLRLKVECVEHLDCLRVRNSDTVKITSADNTHSSELVDVYATRKRALNRIRGSLLVPVADEVMRISSSDTSTQVIVKKSKVDHRLSANRM
ncbi:hypothetical protein AeMF1_008361 [Aphanomyces euteiches]|nr:hypothetical protein AeMF1_008361 [Aphanomyces euteiches]KAH9183954.1 hypothetical protein AeNC1_014071 [Aphanomyces euteiches]